MNNRCKSYASTCSSNLLGPVVYRASYCLRAKETYEIARRLRDATESTDEAAMAGQQRPV
jgi:hypothetical protein